MESNNLSVFFEGNRTSLKVAGRPQTTQDQRSDVIIKWNNALLQMKANDENSTALTQLYLMTLSGYVELHLLLLTSSRKVVVQFVELHNINSKVLLLS